MTPHRAAPGNRDALTTGARTVHSGLGGHSGLTLIEVLVAVMIASLLVLLVGELLRGTRASEKAVDRALDPVQVLDLAAELLSEEVGMAGNRGWPLPNHVDDLPKGDDLLSFMTPGLALGRGAAGDSVTVRYVDDRLAAGPLARSVTFEVGRDSSGEAQLFRRAGSASRQPLVAGVASLHVVALIRAGHVAEPGDATGDEAASRLSALVLRLWAADNSREVVIELPNRPVVEVAP